MSRRHVNLKSRFIRDILKNEICDEYRHIRALRRELFDVVRFISNNLPISIYNNFFVKQNRFQRIYHLHESKKLDKKFN